MKPRWFKWANRRLMPSGSEYSENVTGVDPLWIWTDGEQCLSCWQPTLWERIQLLFHGRIWVSVLSGQTQPPICVTTEKEYLKEV